MSGRGIGAGGAGSPQGESWAWEGAQWNRTGGAGEGGDVEDGMGNSERYSLSVVRLADPEHAQMAELNATTARGGWHCVCSGLEPSGGGSPGELIGAPGGGEGVGAGPGSGPVAGSGGAPGNSGISGNGTAGGDWWGGEVPACVPNKALWLNVSAGVEWVSLHPGLAWPGVAGLRVEVNGQVGLRPLSLPAVPYSMFTVAWLGTSRRSDSLQGPPHGAACLACSAHRFQCGAV